MNRAEDEGRKVVEAAILAALYVAGYPGGDEGNIVEAVQTALDHGDYEDHDGLTALASKVFGDQLSDDLSQIEGAAF